MIVMKFGGTSTEDAVAMRNVVRIVNAHLKSQPVVVISAIARATNELEHIARTAALGEGGQAAELTESLIRRHLAIVRDLIADTTRRDELQSAIEAYRVDLSRLVVTLAAERTPSAKSGDAICSFGERLSSRIVASALEESDIASTWIDVKDFMHTDARFGNARPVMDLTSERIQRVVKPLVTAGRVPVTQGFIGVTALGEYTTMGRESSDYSATIIGALLPAKKVQIWTDVDGILTADPRMIGPVRKVRRMSFEEALQLSRAGAKVLHPTTMVPVMEKEIPVQILNSKREGTGSLVEVASSPARGGVKSIAHKKAMVVVTFSPLGPGSSGAFHAKVLPMLASRGNSPSLVTMSGAGAEMLLDRQVVDEHLVDEMKRYGSVAVHGDKASITLVGKGVGSNADLVGRVAAIAAGGNLSMISGTSSETSLTVVVDAVHLGAVLAKLHKELIEESDDAEMFDAVPRVDRARQPQHA